MKQTSSSIRLLLFIRSSAIPRQGRSRTSTTGGNRYRLSSDKCIGNGKNQIANRWCRQLIKQCIQFCLQTFVCVRKRFVLPSQLIKLPIIRQYITLGTSTCRAASFLYSDSILRTISVNCLAIRWFCRSTHLSVPNKGTFSVI